MTDESARLISCDTKALVCEWKHPNGKNISIATCQRQQMVLAVGKEVFYIEVEEGNLHQVSTTTIEYEVACVDVTPNQAHEKSDLVAVSVQNYLSTLLRGEA